jgi:hypothetical protein
LGNEKPRRKETTEMIWQLMHPQATPETLGFVPDFFSNDNPLSAKEQIEQNYKHGGGFHPFPGFTMVHNGLMYPGDPIMPLLAQTVLHPDTDKPEIIRMYLASWVAIIQKDGSYEICRMD